VHAGYFRRQFLGHDGVNGTKRVATEVIEVRSVHTQTKSNILKELYMALRDRYTRPSTKGLSKYVRKYKYV